MASVVLHCVLISRTENPTTTNRLEIGASNSEQEDPPAATCLPRPIVVLFFHPRQRAADTPARRRRHAGHGHREPSGRPPLSWLSAPVLSDAFLSKR